jgi:hypothetical protein
MNNQKKNIFSINGLIVEGICTLKTNLEQIFVLILVS